MSNYDAGSQARRSPASMSSTGVVAIIATVLALAIGFVVLRRIDNQAGSVTSLGNGSASQVGAGGGVVPTPAATTPDGSVVTGTSVPAGPATTLPQTTFAGATVIVANANATGGSAGRASTLLQSLTDFEMGAATDATGDNIDTSVIYFDSKSVLTAEPVARNLARMLKVATVAPLPDPAPVESLGGATVVLMLGADLANMTQNDLVPPLKASDLAAAAPVLGAGSSTTVTTVAP